MSRAHIWGSGKICHESKDRRVRSESESNRIGLISDPIGFVSDSDPQITSSGRICKVFNRILNDLRPNWMAPESFKELFFFDYVNIKYQISATLSSLFVLFYLSLELYD